MRLASPDQRTPPFELGGRVPRDLENFQVEEIGSYYETTAPIYAKAFAKMGRTKPAAAKPAAAKRKPAGGKKREG